MERIKLIQPYLIGGALLACIALGWTLCGWYEDSKDLAAQNERDEIMQKIRANELVIASHVEKRLQELKANERIIENHTREIVNRPVYRNVCIDDDGLRLINSYALGNTAELIGEMSRNPATDSGQDR